MINEWNQIDFSKKEFNESLDAEEPGYSSIRIEQKGIKELRIKQIEDMINRLLDKVEPKSEVGVGKNNNKVYKE